MSQTNHTVTAWRPDSGQQQSQMSRGQTDVTKSVDRPLKSIAKANISHDVEAQRHPADWIIRCCYILAVLKQAALLDKFPLLCHIRHLCKETLRQDSSPEQGCNEETKPLDTDKTKQSSHAVKAHLCNARCPQLHYRNTKSDYVHLSQGDLAHVNKNCEVAEQWGFWLLWIMLCTCTTVLLFISRIHSTYTRTRK